MPQQTRTTLKSWFETGDKPTQQQFWDWIDSFFHLTDPIAQSSVTGLTAALNEKASQASVDALAPVILDGSGSTVNYSSGGGRILHKVRIKSTSAITSLNIGTSVGGSQILAAENVAANNASIITLDFDIESATTIYFSGLSGTWNIKIVFQ